MSLKAEKGLKQRSREQCKAQRKAAGVCQAPAVEEGLCFFHAKPEKPAELDRQGGKTNRHWNPPDGNLSKIPLKSIGDVFKYRICQIVGRYSQPVRQYPSAFAPRVPLA
jgi:hypothetical protein